ncbi:DUF6992 family protein [Thermus tengchongensis]|uniref:DUF6992 family protein n=1 Tax=Thermus tengchongensis TaxID=1214928 RepID=UPI003B8A6869
MGPWVSTPWGGRPRETCGRSSSSTQGWTSSTSRGGTLLLLRGRKPQHRGFGLAILVQGGFLLAFDLGHALRLAG